MFKSNLEMCWNIKVNFADPLQYRRGPPGGRGPPVFNVFQAKDPQTDGAMEQGPPYYIYCIKLCFILNCA